QRPAPRPAAGCRRWVLRERMKSCRQPSPASLATPPSSGLFASTPGPKGGEPEACPSLCIHMETKTRTRPGGRVDGGGEGGGEPGRRRGEARGRALAKLADRQHGVV